MADARVIVCTGFHRSATSLMAQMLSRGGLPMGRRLIYGHISNPDGHFEDADLVELNDRLLARAGTSWRFYDEVDLPPAEAVSDELRDYIGRRDAAHPRGWGVKDPRVCLFLPHWAQLLGERGRFLVVIRHWSGSLQSLLHRHSRELAYNPFSPGTRKAHLVFWRQAGLAARIWLAYCRRLVRFIDEFSDRVLVVPQPLLFSSFPFADYLNHCWGLALAPPPESVVKADLLNSRSCESLRRLVPPSLEARMERVWQRLLGAVPGEFHEVLGEKALTPEWVGETNDPLCRAAFAAMRPIWEEREEAAMAKHLGLPSSWTRETLLDFLKECWRGEAGGLASVSAWIEDHASEDWELWQALALRAMDIPQLELAEQALLRAIASGSGLPVLWMRLGKVHELAGRWERAEHYYREALRRSPRNPAFLIAYATLLQARGRLDEATEELFRSVSANPVPRTVAALVTLLLDSGRAQEAETLIDGLSRDVPAHGQFWRRQKVRVLMATDLTRAKSWYYSEVRDRLEGESLPEALAEVLDGVNGGAEFGDLVERMVGHWLELFSREELEAKFQGRPGKEAFDPFPAPGIR